MPFYYFDTTALVKRYSREQGTRVVNQLCTKRGRHIIIATPTITELFATLALKSREGELTRDDWYSVLFKFEAEAERGLYNFITPSIQTFITTKRLIVEHPALKTVQAMHLALALELRPLRLSVISSDPNLLEYCRPVGLNSINPEDDA